MLNAIRFNLILNIISIVGLIVLFTLYFTSDINYNNKVHTIGIEAINVYKVCNNNNNIICEDAFNELFYTLSE